MSDQVPEQSPQSRLETMLGDSIESDVIPPELQEEEELQLAIALSRSEVEHKKESGNKMHIQRTYSSPVKVHSTLNKYNNNILMISFRRKIRRQK